MDRRIVAPKKIEIKPGELRCPTCLSKDLAPTMPRGLRDAFMASLGRGPRHCRACGRRFYVAERKTAEEAETPKQP